MKAYVLIQTGAGGEPIARRVEAIPGVISAEDLAGAYDAIAVARVDSTGQLIDQVIRDIRNLPGVTRALPVPLVPSPAEGTLPERSVEGAEHRVVAA